MYNHKLTGLYAITDTAQTDQQKLIIDVEQALLGGVRIIQYRDKTTQHEQRRHTARQLRTLTRQHNTLLIINDDINLARDSHADGVHLGRDDLSITAARTQLGPAAIIGVSCYNDLLLAKQAVNNGADYIAFGRFFPSRTKPHAIQADMEILRRAKRELDIPIAAIGGITAENAGTLINAGADMLAVVNDIFSQLDVKSTACRYQEIFAGRQT
ncbi:MAG: thiamine phosphate synthase [Gammaproteobacteria bacterium]|nr:thiamine phosphate synthase [Gammaproteobacteria bacterium]